MLRQAILQKAIDDAANEARKARNQQRYRTCDHVMECSEPSVKQPPKCKKSNTHSTQQIVTFNLDVADKLQHDALPSMPSSEPKSSKIPLHRKAVANSFATKDQQPTKNAQKSSHLLKKCTTEHKLSPGLIVNQPRVSSPPVPALANKLRKQGLLHEQVWPVIEHSATTEVDTVPPIVFTSARSPPIPASKRGNESGDCTNNAFTVKLPKLGTQEINEAKRHGVILKQLSKLRKVQLMSLYYKKHSYSPPPPQI